MRILFLCTGNSCRSQMAEGFARARANEKLAIASAGIEAHGLNPLAVEMMAEIGIDISGQTSDIFDARTLAEGDLVITVCDRARETCPVLPAAVRRVHWSIDDPAQATGTPEEIRTVFRRVRDEIEREVQMLFDVALAAPARLRSGPARRV
jgi:arsenate reductase